MDDTKVTLSIISEIEYLEFPILCPHAVVCHDGDETLLIITHAIQDVLLRFLIELTTLINHQIQWFHFFFILPIWKPNPYSPFIIVIEAKVLLGSFLIHSYLEHVPIHGVIVCENISK